MAEKGSPRPQPPTRCRLACSTTSSWRNWIAGYCRRLRLDALHRSAPSDGGVVPMLLTQSLVPSAGQTLLRQAPRHTLSLLAFFIASSTLRAQTPNPVLDLRFDEGTGTTAADSSGNN